MSEHKYKKGQKLWTFDFDVTHRTWSVYPCEVVGPCSGIFGAGLTEIKKPDGSSDECRSDYLFNTEKETTEALVKLVRIVRDTNLKGDLTRYTKEIANCWKSIDFCTDLIEQLESDHDKETSCKAQRP